MDAEENLESSLLLPLTDRMFLPRWARMTQAPIEQALPAHTRTL